MRNSVSMILILSFAIFSFAQDSVDEPEVLVDPLADLLMQAEVAHDAKDYEATMKLLKAAEELDGQNEQVLWKISRGYFDFADRKPNDLEYKKKYIYDGRAYAEKALALNDKSAGGHKWYAIHHGQIGEAEGTEQKIKNSYGMRDHTMLAIKYDPSNAGNYHVMGRWHFALSDLSWLERQVASIIYATPPEASFEEALEFFTKAHDLDNKDIRNMLYIGYCYDELGNDEEAADWLNMAMNANASSDSDRGLQVEAKEALDDL